MDRQSRRAELAKVGGGFVDKEQRAEDYGHQMTMRVLKMDKATREKVADLMAKDEVTLADEAVMTAMSRLYPKWAERLERMGKGETGAHYDELEAAFFNGLTSALFDFDFGKQGQRGRPDYKTIQRQLGI